MAKINNFIYCLNPVIDEKGVLSANSIISAITPDYIPGGFSFSVIATILDIKSTDNQFTLQFMSPDNEVLVLVDNIKLPQNTTVTDNLPNEYKGVNLSLNLQNVVFKKSGLYKTRVICNESEFVDFPIYAKGKMKHEHTSLYKYYISIQ